MTKKEFVKLVAKELNTTQAVANECVSGVFEVITNALAHGDEVKVPGFGKFCTANRAERLAINPQNPTGDKIVVPATTVCKFKPSLALKEAVK